ncbi:MAG: hypothetical protein SGJ15_07985 [Bacteroidota bacterium]|nr:hypothetical protein [Bacteroidota bacterium]
MFLNETKHELNNEPPNRNVSINVVMSMLGVSDIRTAVKWCKMNGIFIFKIGKQKCVNRIDLELAIDKPFIESLKEKHPENWKEIYTAYKNRDYLAVLDQKSQAVSKSKIKFIAPGESGNNFLKKVSKGKK